MIWIVLVAVALGWLSREREVRALRQLLAESDADCKAATDRLLAAWKDGYTVPLPEAEPFVEDPLPPALQEIVDAYEDPLAQAKAAAAIRRKLNAGRTEDQIVMDAEVGQL